MDIKVLDDEVERILIPELRRLAEKFRVCFVLYGADATEDQIGQESGFHAVIYPCEDHTHLERHHNEVVEIAARYFAGKEPVEVISSSVSVAPSSTDNLPAVIEPPPKKGNWWA